MLVHFSNSWLKLSFNEVFFTFFPSFVTRSEVPSLGCCYTANGMFLTTRHSFIQTLPSEKENPLRDCLLVSSSEYTIFTCCWVAHLRPAPARVIQRLHPERLHAMFGLKVTLEPLCHLLRQWSDVFHIVSTPYLDKFVLWWLDIERTISVKIMAGMARQGRIQTRPARRTNVHCSDELPDIESTVHVWARQFLWCIRRTVHSGYGT